MTAFDHPVYVLRTCAAGMTSHGGFVWPGSGPVEAPDWDPAPECGRGLHGLLWGEGDGGLLDWSPDARWLIVEIAPGTPIVDLGGKVKFPRGVVVHRGDSASATAHIIGLGARGAVAGAAVSAGHHGTATAGHDGTATAAAYAHLRVEDLRGHLATLDNCRMSSYGGNEPRTSEQKAPRLQGNQRRKR